jgi:hypothetical protein
LGRIDAREHGFGRPRQLQALGRPAPYRPPKLTGKETSVRTGTVPRQPGQKMASCANLSAASSRAGLSRRATLRELPSTLPSALTINSRTTVPLTPSAIVSKGRVRGGPSRKTGRSVSRVESGATVSLGVLPAHDVALLDATGCGVDVGDGEQYRAKRAAGKTSRASVGGNGGCLTDLRELWARIRRQHLPVPYRRESSWLRSEEAKSAIWSHMTDEPWQNPAA